MKRRLLWGVGVPLALGLVLMLVLPRLVSGDALRNLVVDAITEATGAQVELGEATVGTWPRLAVTLAEGRITGTGAALTACSGTETDIETYAADVNLVELRMALWPLLRGEIEVASVRVDVPRLEITLPEDRIALSGAVLRLHDLTLAVPEDEPAAGAPPGALIPVDLACRADLEVARLTASGADYEQVTAEAALAGRVITVDPVRAERGGGVITGTATVDYVADPWGRLTFEFAAEGVPAAELLGPWAPDIGTRLVSDLTAAGRGSCSLQDPDSARATLGLEGTVTAGDGVLHAGDWLQEVLPYLGKRHDLVDVRFRGLDHAFRVADGRYLVDRLEIDGLDTTWRGAGWVGLDDSIDLDLAVKLPPGFTPDLGAWSFLAETLRDANGRVQLDLTLTGRSSKPKVGLDLAGLRASAREDGGESAKKGLGGLLDKWKNR
ncbi:MAG: hypothetical protein GY838_08370 [bacterium]|nr:hypothetical protein [bacterium]